jgi:hypothetical protein
MSKGPRHWRGSDAAPKALFSRRCYSVPPCWPFCEIHSPMAPLNLVSGLRVTTWETLSCSLHSSKSLDWNQGEHPPHLKYGCSCGTKANGGCMYILLPWETKASFLFSKRNCIQEAWLWLPLFHVGSHVCSNGASDFCIPLVLAIII